MNFPLAARAWNFSGRQREHSPRYEVASRFGEANSDPSKSHLPDTYILRHTRPRTNAQ